MRLNHTTLAFPAVFASMLMFGLVSQVQAQQPTQPPPQYDSQSTEHQHFSRKQLESFTSAHEKVREISTKYIERLEHVHGQEEKMKLHEQAQAEMANAVQDEGLTVTTYNTILLAARKDPALAQRIYKMLNQ
jgi:hypothetical protein